MVGWPGCKVECRWISTGSRRSIISIFNFSYRILNQKLELNDENAEPNRGSCFLSHCVENDEIYDGSQSSHEDINFSGTMLPKYRHRTMPDIRVAMPVEVTNMREQW